MGSSPLLLQKRAPTRAAAEGYVDDYLKRVLSATDANDLIFYIDASRNYDPSPNLERITVPVLYINSADDFINPPELNIMPQMIKRVPKGTFVLLPITEQTRGHGTHTMAAVWQQYLAKLLEESGPVK